MRERIDLQSCTCLQALTAAQLNWLMLLSDEVLVSPGQVFFEEGELLSSLYLLLTGSVALSRRWPVHVETFVRSLGPGELFGWSALKAPYWATAGAKALTPCQALSFSRERLASVLTKQDGWLTMKGQGETAVSDEHIRHFPVVMWVQECSPLVSMDSIGEQGGELMYEI